jgi:hypothetical protein
VSPPDWSTNGAVPRSSAEVQPTRLMRPRRRSPVSRRTWQGIEIGSSTWLATQEDSQDLRLIGFMGSQAAKAEDGRARPLRSGLKVGTVMFNHAKQGKDFSARALTYDAEMRDMGALLHLMPGYPEWRARERR